MEPGQRIIVDTNVIIEAHRVKCWKALVGRFKLETTDYCVTEAGSGDAGEPGYVPVDTEALRKGILVHQVSPARFAAAALRAAGMGRIDDGEREVLAFAAGEPVSLLVSCADRRAVAVGHEMGLLDRFVALEEMAEAAGMRCQFKAHFTTRALSVLKTNLQLGLS